MYLHALFIILTHFMCLRHNNNKIPILLHNSPESIKLKPGCVTEEADCRSMIAVESRSFIEHDLKTTWNVCSSRNGTLLISNLALKEF